MKNGTIQKRIALAFASIVVIACALTIYAFARLSAIQTQASALTASGLPLMQLLGRLDSSVKDDFILVERHLFAANGETKLRLESQLQIHSTNLARLLEQVHGFLTPTEERPGGESLQTALADYAGQRADLLTRSRPLKSPETAEPLWQQVQPAFQRLITAIRTLSDASNARSLLTAGRIQPAVVATKLGLVAGLFVSLIVVIVSGGFLVRAIHDPLAALVRAMERIENGDLTGRLEVQRSDEFGKLAAGFNRMAESLGVLVTQVQTSGQQVNRSTHQIAATSRQQQQTAREIAETTLEIGHTSKQISTTSKDLVATIQELAGIAGQTSQLADQGQTGLQRMHATIQQIMGASSGIASKLAILNEKANNISAVVTTISKVADQTNLLSLNAAIEAEKAGEYGLGFSVVATEIRRLADRTAVATNDIEKMVQEMQTAVTAGVMGMDKFAEAVRTGVDDVNQVGAQLGQIIEQVQVLTPRFEAVNGGMKTQAAGTQQISEALIHLSDSARQTAESLKQSSEVVERLHGASRGLQQGVGRFKFDVCPV